jgi:hypothetical protein
MITIPILRRLFLTLAIIAITAFPIGLYYQNDVSYWTGNVADIRLKADRTAQECERLKQPVCGHYTFVNLIESFEGVAKQSRAVAFWWFLVGWLSVAVMVGYFVVTWIVTGNPFSAKREPTTE